MLFQRGALIIRAQKTVNQSSTIVNQGHSNHEGNQGNVSIVSGNLAFNYRKYTQILTFDCFGPKTHVINIKKKNKKKKES